MAWLNQKNAPIEQDVKRKETPDGFWWNCSHCHEVSFKRDFEQNQNVCPKCRHHFHIPVHERIQRFVDPDSFVEFDQDLCTQDPLNFKDANSTYKERLEKAQKKTGRKDSLVSGEATLMQRPIQLAVFDFEFLGGSMGAVVGEKITRTILRGVEKQQPVVIFSASGGARMHEGIFSLMQMAKTCTALAKLRTAGVPYVSILTHPTTGGVAASFATLGDINLAEPGALIGFAGPRVIQQTIGEELPEGFQTSEYLLEHGMLDMICLRDRLRVRVSQILNILCPKIPNKKQ